MSSLLQSLSPLEFGTIGCLIGLILSASLTSDELNSLGNFLELVGQVMLTVQAQMETVSPQYTHIDSFNNLKKDLDEKFKNILNKKNKL
ncbi:MAG: hypothetical protein MRZ09_07810 [Coprobacillus sp.]|nr:hypothetical protein [Coprobacillus sp.]MDY4145916.1 hypothetical protein [Bacilli bacterium]OLA10768.1 MAG: hypothetical protein BHW12_01245 [Coprobacillus sp. 28_7]CCY08418.1 putative uncharacterized protein [Coprobacillus sp. CAG:698]